MLSSQTQLWNNFSWVHRDVGKLALRKLASCFHTLFAPSLYAF
jgi:hypothetical protein